MAEFSGDGVLNMSGFYAGDADAPEIGTDEADAVEISDGPAAEGKLDAAEKAVPVRGKLVIFASERIGKGWISPFFNSIPEGIQSHNQCETSLGEILGSMGFESAEESFTTAQKDQARKLRTVFMRYQDMSTMANDTAVRASDIVDSRADAVVLCTVDVGAKKGWRKKGYKSCAEVRCKAVSTDSRLRVATHSIERCAGGLEETAASVEAVRSVCSEAGRGIGEKLIALEGKGK